MGNWRIGKVFVGLIAIGELVIARKVARARNRFKEIDLFI